MKRALCAAVAAVAVAAFGLSASASAAPPITPPGFSTCTFSMGLTTCAQATGSAYQLVGEIYDPSCPETEKRVQITEGSSTTTTTWVFRGMQQLGEPTTETTTTGPTTRDGGCVVPPPPE
jgi:hypothetical protein